MASSFEIARGYTPQTSGVTKAPLAKAVFVAHNEQVARRALHQFIKAKQSPTIAKDLLLPKTPVYFFRKEVKAGLWHKGYGVTKEPLEKAMFVAHNEQVARRALHQFIKARKIPTIAKDLLLPKKPFTSSGTTLRPEFDIRDIFSSGRPCPTRLY